MIATDVDRLRKQIEAAHERYGRTKSPADFEALWALQSEYRMRASVTAQGRGGSGGTVRLSPGYGVDLEWNRTSRAPAQGWPTVTMAKGVLGALDGFDGREAAGYLFGSRTEDAIHITRFVEAHLEDGRTRRSVSLDLERGLQVWASLDSNLTLLGDAHSHPAIGERLWPSTHDVACWEASSQDLKQPWVGIVVREAATHVRGLGGRFQESTRFEVHATLANGASHRFIEIVEEI